MPELWQPIKGYEGLYEVSNQGRVRSLERKVRCMGGHRTVHERVLLPGKDLDGYRKVDLCSQGVATPHRVARLVANAFVDGDKSLTVNHKDFVRSNDAASNLEWISVSDNIRHSYQGFRRHVYSEAEWQTLLIRIKNGEKQADIAAELGLSPQSFSQMKKRALKRLQLT
mgnify:CR=1 FL=1